MRRENNNSCSYPVVILIVALAAAPGVAAPLDNGNFESGLTPWIDEGTVTIEPSGGGNAAVLHEPDSRGLSRIYQEFDIPAGAQWLSFRYRLLTNAFGDSIVPPDCFSVGHSRQWNK